MTAELFHITCTTCQARLKVHNPAAIGLILECPRCHSMVRVVPPAGWDPPPAVPSSPVASSADLPPEVPTDLPPDVPGDVPADVPARDDGVDTAPADVPADSAEVSVAAGRWPRPILWAAAAGLSLLVVGGIAIVVMLVSPAAPAGRSVVARADLRPVVPARDRVAAAPESTSVRSSAGPAEKPAPGPAPAAGRKPAANAMPAASSSPQHRTRTVPEGAATGRASSSTAGKKTKKRVPRAPSPPSVRRKAPAPPATTPSTAPPEREKSTTTVGQKAPRKVGRPSPRTTFVHRAGRPGGTSAPVAVQARLEGNVRQIDFDPIALVDLIDFLVELTRVPITLDLDALQRVGAEPTDRVSIHERDTTVGHILTAALASHGLTYTADDRQVVVTAPGPPWKTVLYRVDDLLRAPPGPDPAPTLDSLADRIRQLVAPATWKRAGGRGVIRSRDGALEIDQSPVVHYEILVFCEKLRKARGLPLRSRLPAARFRLVSRRGRIREVLDRDITFTFAQPTPITQVVAYLRRATGLVITTNWRLLAAKEIFPDSQIACAVIDRPLGAALSAILEPIGLAWRATECGSVEIITAAAAAERLELEFYPLSRAAKPAVVPTQLPAEIRGSVDKDSWREAGGAGQVVYDRAAATLIVRQTQPVQARVERWLNQRSALRSVP